MNSVSERLCGSKACSNSLVELSTSVPQKHTGTATLITIAASSALASGCAAGRRARPGVPYEPAAAGEVGAKLPVQSAPREGAPASWQAYNYVPKRGIQLPQLLGLDRVLCPAPPGFVKVTVLPPEFAVPLLMTHSSPFI